MLAPRGHHQLAQLREPGAARAYVRTKRVNPRVSLNLLWALESALSGERCPLRGTAGLLVAG
ncbi:MAG: TfoX/Sxy family DNA transformation protein [Uliginosibacterium sp.]|nr:TfoX/Sxy family DNA transformation protein [Uliginosibacterium sp.]